MSSKETYKLIKTELAQADRQLKSFFSEMEKLAKENGNKAIVDALKHNKSALGTYFPKLLEHLSQFKQEEEEDSQTQTRQLLHEIEQLKKAKDSVVSNNFLLEYKKKDLLLLADNLEDAYEEISAKNNELEEQKRRISEQADKIKKANEEILEKNDELEQQKEAILDQADYLHEANKTITSMHEEVQKQKDEILKKNEELINLNNEKNNLIGIVAHDLKSPLNQIKGLISVIKISADSLDEGTKKYIDIIEGSATRLNEMIAKILDIEAIESKSLNLNMQAINLSNLLEECVERYKLTAESKLISLHSSIEKGLMAEVDPDFANQVFENLISNAIKFSPKRLNIHISLSFKNGQIIGAVKDEGPGINQEDMKKLFGKYQKLSAKPTGDETSTGLGLSIVKKFVEAMGGQIWCESEAGKGASFFVSFQPAN